MDLSGGIMGSCCKQTLGNTLVMVRKVKLYRRLRRMSYHKIKIHKHDFGSPYKLQEEATEYIDAVATNNKIMALVELSDLFGCLEHEVSKYGMTVEELKVMSDATKSAFTSGARGSEGLLDYLKRECDSISTWGLGFVQVKCGGINYNFYHKDVQMFDSAPYPHNHQRDFVSEIIKGELSEITYLVNEGSVSAYCGCGDTSVEDKGLDWCEDSHLNYTKGDLYLRLKEDYHSVSAAHGTVTKVVKYGDKSNAYIIAPRETKKIKHIPESVCWRMVEEVLNV